MHAASDLIKTAIDPQSMKSEKPSCAEKRQKLPQPLLDKLWLKMAEIYGRRWTGSFGVSADQSHAWAATLGGLTGEQIAVGLNALATTEDDQLRKWPPSAPEFRALFSRPGSMVIAPAGEAGIVDQVLDLLAEPDQLEAASRANVVDALRKGA